MISTRAKTLPTATEGCQLCNELDLETQRADSRGGFFGPARLRAWDSTVSSSGVRGGALKNLDLEVLWVLMSERSLSEVQHCPSLLLYSSTYCCYYGTGSIPGRQVVAASTTVIHTQARYCLLTANWGYVTTE